MPYDLTDRSFQFSKNVVLFIKDSHFDKMFKSILDQLLRSATSIGANIIEGRSGNSRKNLIGFYSIALRSANETKYWLRLLKETVKTNESEIELLGAECNEISKILAKSIINLKKSERV